MKYVSRFFVMLLFVLVCMACTKGEQLPPLHMAAQDGLLVEVKQLVIGGHDVNQRDEKYGFTPIHQAVFFDHQAVVEFLIAQGANVNAKNNAGSTPLHLARGKGHSDIVELLTQHGAVE